MPRLESRTLGDDAIVWGYTFEDKIPVWYDLITKGQYALPASSSPIVREGVCPIFIVYVPSIVLSFACFVYAGLALRHFMIRRISFATHLASSSALTTSRYMRFILMSVMQMVWALSITGFTLAYTASSVPLRPWTDWSDVHSDFLRVDQFYLGIFPKSVQHSYHFLWWTVPASTFIFVAFFAFGKEAMDHYKAAFSFCYRLVSRRDNPLVDRSGKRGLKPLQLPLHHISNPRPKRSDSFTSSTVVASPTYKSKEHSTDMSTSTCTPPPYSPSHTRASLDSEEVTFAVYSPSSSPVALRFPDSPTYPPSPTSYSVYTVSSLSAFPEHPSTTAPATPPAAVPKYSRHSSRF